MNGDIKYLNELEKHLYGQKKGLPRFHETKLKPKTYGVNPEWEAKKEEPGIFKKPKMSGSIFKKFFFISIAFFIIALGVSLIIFLSGGSIVSSENIAISVSGTGFATGGEKLPLLVEISNKNSVDLELADLVIKYPKCGLDGEEARLRETIGTIGANQTVTKVVEPILLGEEGSTKDLIITLEYRLANSNAIFVKELKHSVVLSSSPILVEFDAPTAVTSDQDFVLNIKVTSNSSNLLSGTSLSLRYPSGFVVSDSTPTPIFSNNFFDLGDLAPGASKNISIRGKLLGGEGETRTFSAEIGEADKMSSGRLATVYSAKLHSVVLGKAFIEARILVAGEYKPEYTRTSQTDIPVAINYANNLDERVDNLEIRVKLTGFFDKSEVDVSDGFYDSNTDTIIFNRNTNSDFAFLDPGARGSVGFSLSSLPTFSAGKLATDPQIDLEVSIKGNQPTFGTTSEVNNFEKRTIKIASDLQLIGSLKTGAGPIPPKVGQETIYTVVWNIANSSNIVSDARVISTLPPYVRFVGNITPTGQLIAFNENTREVSWRAGQIPRGAGLISSPKEATFQIGFTPSASQIGTTPIIIGDSILTGNDTFAKTSLQARQRSLNTNSAGSGTVVE
ncbi:MAG TPA: hypothetical protein VJC04_02465 [Candidatus Paceibacterota bacterium]